MMKFLKKMRKQVKLCILVARYNDEIKFEEVPQEKQRKMSLEFSKKKKKQRGDSSELNKENRNNTNAKGKEKDNDITTTLSKENEKESEANYKLFLIKKVIKKSNQIQVLIII